MNYYVVSDTHFGHEKMVDYCGRPENFELLILNNMKATLKPDDVLIHLGDFCIGSDKHWHEMFRYHCQCRKWLVKGNHDRRTNSWYFKHGWDFVADGVILDIFGKRVALSHHPLTAENTFDINVHGHLHNTGHHPEVVTSDKHRLVYLEHTYRPIKLKTIIGV